MPYCTSSQMESHFGAVEVLQLLDRDRDGVADTGVLTAVQVDTDDLIDGYLRAANTPDLPLATVPAMITGIAADIQRFKLWKDRASEEVRKRYEDAIKRLGEIARGVIVLDLETPATPTGDVGYTERTRTFSDTTMTSFMGGFTNDDY